MKNAKPGRQVDGRGLCLLVKDSGARTWVLRMQKDGRQRDYGLGSALDVSFLDKVPAKSCSDAGPTAPEPVSLRIAAG
ncbi:Arm DNA-binding domain-containing protein [Sphingobium ummariense]